MSQPPLSYEPSAQSMHVQVTNTLPAEVVQCLQNARFLHLATCTDLFPHVSLMNYTYLPGGESPYTPTPTIIMTTNPSSKKTQNLVTNPNVSLLVHDWVSHRPPNAGNRRLSTDRTGSPPPEVRNSSLATLLANLNTSALSSISATINGEARLVERGTEEERYFRECHLDNNTFGEEGENGGGHRWGDGLEGGVAPDGGRGTFIEGEEVRVVAVRIRDGRVADWKGAVRDFAMGDVEGVRDVQVARGGGLVNGG